jgi:hypothetical protein
MYANEVTTKKLQRSMKEEEQRRGRTHRSLFGGDGATASL